MKDIDFGRYKGKNFEYVARTNRNYAVWMLNNSKSKNLAQYIEGYENCITRKILPPDRVMNFGKWKGRKICDLIVIEPRYIEWLLDNGLVWLTIEEHKKLRSVLKKREEDIADIDYANLDPLMLDSLIEPF